MKLEKRFDNVRFSVEVIREAMSALPGGERASGYGLTTRVGAAEWSFDTDAEFFAEYRKGPEYAYGEFAVWNEEGNESPEEAGDMTIHVHGRQTIVSVGARDRPSIEEVMHVFEAARESSTVPAPPPPEPPRPVVFVGHGRSPQWRDLKDHLREHHGYDIQAYEVGARAGHTIRDILEEMLSKSTFAILVMTGEDVVDDGSVRARENVVHEAGLFQGRLGFNRAIVVVEEGVEHFSNLQGIQQVRYSRENIRETYGDVLATIRREFP